MTQISGQIRAHCEYIPVVRYTVCTDRSHLMTLFVLIAQAPSRSRARRTDRHRPVKPTEKVGTVPGFVTALWGEVLVLERGLSHSRQRSLYLPAPLRLSRRRGTGTPFIWSARCPTHSTHVRGSRSSCCRGPVPPQAVLTKTGRPGRHGTATVFSQSGVAVSVPPPPLAKS